jgi:hypothetical protein
VNAPPARQRTAARTNATAPPNESAASRVPNGCARDGPRLQSRGVREGEGSKMDLTLPEGWQETWPEVRAERWTPSADALVAFLKSLSS